MGASLTQPRRVSDEGLRVVKLCGEGGKTWVRIGLGVDGTSLASTG
jgi:hypothetical protein